MSLSTPSVKHAGRLGSGNAYLHLLVSLSLMPLTAGGVICPNAFIASTDYDGGVTVSLGAPSGASNSDRAESCRTKCLDHTNGLKVASNPLATPVGGVCWGEVACGGPCATASNPSGYSCAYIENSAIGAFNAGGSGWRGLEASMAGWLAVMAALAGQKVSQPKRS